MTSRRTCQGAHERPPSEIDELLDKVRKLQKMLPSPSGTNSRPRSSGMEPNLPLTRTPTRPVNGDPCGSGRDDEIQCISGPTLIKAPCARRSPPQTKSGKSTSAIDSDKGSLVVEAEESIELLRLVTFVRVVIDEIIWDSPPDILRRDFGGRNKSPREKGQLIVEYGFPESTSESRTLKKKVRAHAKTVNPSVAHFNHRRVALVKITAPIVQLWSRSSLWFRILYKTPERGGKNSTRLLGRCQIPLDDLLIMPFSVSEDLPIECLNEFYGSKGNLRLCVQLGSRSSTFGARVDPVREKTGFSSKKPLKRVDYQSMDPRLLNKRLGVRDEEETDRSTRILFNSNGDISATSTPQKQTNQEPIEWDQRPLPPSPFEFSPKNLHYPSLRPITQTRREDTRDTQSRKESRRSSTGVMLSSTQPQISPHSPAWIDQGVQSTSWKSTGCQTDEQLPGKSVANSSREVDAATQERLEIRTDPGKNKNFKSRLSQSDRIPRSTLLLQPRFPDRLAQSSSGLPIADRNEGTSTDRHNETFTLLDSSFLRQSKCNERDGEKQMTDTGRTEGEEGMGGYLLEITVHSASRLPYVKGTSKNPSAQKPNVFVSYRGEENIRTSPVIANSTDPSWDWKTFFYVCKGRKNIVLKVWHRCPERGDRVLGFVSCDLPEAEPAKRSTGEYDLVDLSQSSTGRLMMTLGPGSEPKLTKIHLAGYTGQKNTPKKSANKHSNSQSSQQEEPRGLEWSSRNCFGESIDYQNGLSSNIPSERTSRRKNVAEEQMISGPTSHHSQGTTQSAVMNRSMNTSLAYLDKLEHSCPISPNPFEMASVSFLESKLKSNMQELENMLSNLESGKQRNNGAGTFRLRVGSTSDGSSSSESRPQSQEPCVL